MKKARQYAQVDQLLLGRNSLRSIVHATGVARNTIAKRLKNPSDTCPSTTSPAPEKGTKKRWEALEFDEMWTFVGHKKK